MNERIASFLSSKLVYKNANNVGEHTHNSMHPAGTYFIPNDHEAEFWNIYLQEFNSYMTRRKEANIDQHIQTILSDRNEPNFKRKIQDLFKKLNFKCTVSERPKQVMPVLGDLDFKFPVGPTHTISSFPRFNLYTIEHIKHIVSIYQRVLSSLNYTVDIKPNNLDCFVLTKPFPSEILVGSNTFCKMGFHLHFPFFYMLQSHQDQYVYKRVLQLAKEEQLFIQDPICFNDKAIPFEEDQLETVIDKHIETKHWLLYGSKKDTNLLTQPYLLKWIFQFNALDPQQPQEISLRESIEDHNNVIYNWAREPIDCDELTDDELEYYLPLMLTTRMNNPELLTYTVRNNVDIQISKPLNLPPLSEADEITVRNNLAQAEKLITEVINSQKRAESYPTWCPMGWLLHNISQGSEEGLRLFKQFSQFCEDKYDEASCVTLWERQYHHQSDKKIGMTTLKKWAQEDNPNLYDAWLQENKKRLLEFQRYESQEAIARHIVYETFKDRWVCADSKKNLWFRYDNHRWNIDQDGVQLQNILPGFITETLQKHLDELKRTQDANEDMANVKCQENIRKLIHQKVGSNNWFSGLWAFCKKLFLEQDFCGKLNQNAYLLGFTNGVLDLNVFIDPQTKLKRVIGFRAGKPSDYISKSCRYDFKTFSFDDPLMAEIEDFMVKLFPKKSVRDFMFKTCGLIIRGGNNEKTFLVASGVGDNGKSVLVDLIDKVLGDYMVKLPISFLTQKRGGSSSASPETARLEGTRLAILQEPSEHERIQEGTLKEYTGNDSTYERDLFQGGRDVKQLHKMWLICNKLPNLTASDTAVWNRVRRVIFESKFPKDPKMVPATLAERFRRRIFPRDDFLNERLDFWKQPMMYRMFLEYQDTLIRAKPDPADVTNATLQYLENNDPYFQFKRQRLIVAAGHNIDVNTMFETYKEWHQEFFNNTRFPIKSQFQNDCKRCLGEIRRGNFCNIRLRTDQDDNVYDNDEEVLLEIDDVGDETIQQQIIEEEEENNNEQLSPRMQNLTIHDQQEDLDFQNQNFQQENYEQDDDNTMMEADE